MLKKYLILTVSTLMMISCLQQEEPETDQPQKPDVFYEDCVKLSLPRDGETLGLEDTRDSRLLFQWLTDEYGVSCKLVIADNIQMENPLVIDCGAVSRFPMSHDRLDEILAGYGVPEYRKGTIYWTVTYRQDHFVLSSVPNRLDIYRQCHPFKDKRDGQEYKVCRIVDEATGQYSIWLAENLRAVKYTDGTPLEEGTYGFYKEDKSLREIFGAYYTWDAAVGDQKADPQTGYVQGIAPTGWHIPSVKEWNFVRVAADKGLGAPTELMNPIYWDADSKNSGVNSFLFNAAGAGYVYKMPLSVVSGVKNSTYYWAVDTPQPGESYGGVSDPEKFKGTALTCGITKDRNAMPIYFYMKNRGLSVRCVLD